MSDVKLSKIVDGRKINQWNLSEEPWKNRTTGESSRVYVIKRWVVDEDGKGHTERYPREKYALIAKDQEELERLVRRLNQDEFGAIIKKEAIKDRLAGLFERELEKYEVAVKNRIPSAEGVKREMAMLRTHVVNVFVAKLGLTNPKDWYQKGRDAFTEYLLSDEAPASSFSKSQAVQVANRFVKWLHEERPNEVPQMTFQKPGKSMLQMVERRRVVEGKRTKRTAIKSEDWAAIVKALDTEEWKHIRAPAKLAMAYGLRRSESFGLAFEGVESVRGSYLSLKRQMTNWNRFEGPRFELLKTPGRINNRSEPVEERKIPHWLGIDLDDACDLIEEMMANLMHPDTFTHEWMALIESLFKKKQISKKYVFHEVRHTWITNCRAVHPSRDVQLAAGHKSIQTTEGYSSDHRDMESAPHRRRKSS